MPTKGYRFRFADNFSVFSKTLRGCLETLAYEMANSRMPVFIYEIEEKDGAEIEKLIGAIADKPGIGFAIALSAMANPTS